MGLFLALSVELVPGTMAAANGRPSGPVSGGADKLLKFYRYHWKREKKVRKWILDDLAGPVWTPIGVLAALPVQLVSGAVA
jgi:hypothetical protein